MKLVKGYRVKKGKAAMLSKVDDEYVLTVKTYDSETGEESMPRVQKVTQRSIESKIQSLQSEVARNSADNEKLRDLIEDLDELLSDLKEEETEEKEK